MIVRAALLPERTIWYAEPVLAAEGGLLRLVGVCGECVRRGPQRVRHREDSFPKRST